MLAGGRCPQVMPVYGIWQAHAGSVPCLVMRRCVRDLGEHLRDLKKKIPKMRDSARHLVELAGYVTAGLKQLHQVPPCRPRALSIGHN